jgi:hypothetical protein
MSPARSSIFLTDVAYHFPPRAVATLRVQRRGKLVQRNSPRPLRLPNDRQYVRGVVICGALDGGYGYRAGLVELREPSVTPRALPAVPGNDTRSEAQEAGLESDGTGHEGELERTTLVSNFIQTPSVNGRILPDQATVLR